MVNLWRCSDFWPENIGGEPGNGPEKMMVTDGVWVGQSTYFRFKFWKSWWTTFKAEVKVG